MFQNRPHPIIERRGSLWSLLLAAIMLVVLMPGQMAVAAPISVVDDSGRTVTLQAPAERVVALAPHAVEMLYAIGAGEALVGAIEGSDYPEAAKALPRVGSYRGIALEAVLARTPDLVVTWASGTPRALVERLSALGIPVYASEPRRLAQVAENLRELGQLTGQAEAGKALASDFTSRLAVLRQELENPPRVFYQLGANPLTTLAGGHIVSEVIRHCGGEPLFAQSPVLVSQISREALLQARPEVILSASHDDAWKADWQRWKLLPAVREGRLYTLDPDLINRPGPRIIEAVEAVCAALASNPQ
ncbi:iron complex transport system substrate-binding protein [Modicisalibacter muralis]|uniref:Iron complex transport system substrate-binding protein n=1 Tax=Modicisalibacter muralis TaxID=119000 RepID=A0A1G9MGB7_9GAMM|nr:cobalamin-binding protein [Halomonas muralis]SDL72947.1 iron complex transport system substrate-binding protein [Halomonas muralis]